MLAPGQESNYNKVAVIMAARRGPALWWWQAWMCKVCGQLNSCHTRDRTEKLWRGGWRRVARGLWMRVSTMTKDEVGGGGGGGSVVLHFLDKFMCTTTGARKGGSFCLPPPSYFLYFLSPSPPLPTPHPPPLPLQFGQTQVKLNQWLCLAKVGRLHKQSLEPNRKYNKIISKCSTTLLSSWCNLFSVVQVLKLWDIDNRVILGFNRYWK